MANKSSGKVVILGLELGDGRLVHAWAQQGRLPAFKRLMDAGMWGWLTTTADRLHISAWPSIYTGATPGEHGVYFTFQPAPGLQGYRRFHPGLYGRPTFWQLLDQAGRKCVVLDPPYSHPEDGYGGVFIYDWGSWAHYLQPGSVPATMLRDMEKNVGAYPLGLEANNLGFQKLDPKDTQQRLLGAVRSKAKAVQWLMGQPWDVMFTVFGETHVAGHYCAPESNDQAARDASNALMLGVYQEIDAALAQIQTAAGPDATIVIISGDAVSQNYAGWHLLPDMLTKLGYLGKADPGGGNAGNGAKAPPVQTKFDPVKAFRDLLPKNFRKSLARMLPTQLRDKLAQRVDTADINWSQTKAYCLPTDLEGYIRINLKGREPQGVVEPGAEYEAALADLTGALLEMRDPASGRAIVREVIRTDEAFPGPRRDFLPDLIVAWDAAGPITAATSPRVGTVSSPTTDTRSGTHTGPGFVLVHGPDIARGSTLQSADILDFAPTLLSRLGVAVPGYMHGQVWGELTTARN